MGGGQQDAKKRPSEHFFYARNQALVIKRVLHINGSINVVSVDLLAVKLFTRDDDCIFV
jgi:hypothetical protein